MRFSILSPKQKEIFTWAHQHGNEYDGIAADGAIRSGKTVCMSCSYIMWAMSVFDDKNFAICGKTVRSAKRNIIKPIQASVDLKAYYKLDYNNSENLLTVTSKKTRRKNYFYVFGGKDESSADLIQGITLAGVLLDEVALMPQSFVEQAIARCSEEGSKFWFNCNPKSPEHWFYKEWILKANEKKLYHLHFTFDDNPVMPEEMKQRYKNLYIDSPIFYKRFILGLWVAADGLVYDVDLKSIIVDSVPDKKKGRYFISIDYGTLNAFSAGLWCVNGKTATRVKEYYYSGREEGKLKTDEEYYKEVEKLADGCDIEKIIVDPSAASFIACIKKHKKFRVKKAKNNVIDGIRVTAEMINHGAIKIHSSCESIIKEFGLYHWDQKKTDEDAVVKENDHAMDDMRYFCYTILTKLFKWENYE